jgi:hypothetical protein
VRLPKTIALWLALRKTTTPEERKKVKRSIGNRYAKRKAKAAA